MVILGWWWIACSGSVWVGFGCSGGIGVVGGFCLFALVGLVGDGGEVL